MNIAIILASGTGERTGLQVLKQFLKVAGKMVIEHTLDTPIGVDKNNSIQNISKQKLFRKDQISRTFDLRGGQVA